MNLPRDPSLFCSGPIRGGMRPAGGSPGAASHALATVRGAGGTASSASASASGCARAASELPLAPICCSRLVAGVVQEGMGSNPARRLQQHRDTQGDAQQSINEVTALSRGSRRGVEPSRSSESFAHAPPAGAGGTHSRWGPGPAAAGGGRCRHPLEIDELDVRHVLARVDRPVALGYLVQLGLQQRATGVGTTTEVNPLSAHCRMFLYATCYG